jgi:hypothetical protein
MKKFCFILSITLYTATAWAQTNISVTNPEAYDILKGNFEGEDYLPSVIVNHPEDIAETLVAGVSADSLKSYLEALGSFGNRNTGSDTVSADFGFGAARRWVFDKFQSFSQRNEGRLISSYLQFDQNVCGMGQHRNIFAVLPGIGPQRDEVILVEGHMDSRCEDVCDVNCSAPGIDDNGSGTALVLELARVMSGFAFNRTLVFLVTTGEEQGLFGAAAFAQFCLTEGINVTAVLNNDIVGGVICGTTASPPGCPGLNHIDSINVRLYSLGISGSKHKNLARFIKLEYTEMAAPLSSVQTTINIMTPEDRSGRGGDHIPFRQKGFTAVRFTSANEHGHGNPAAPGYDDRQHTTDDILGVDTDSDGVIDSFFVDFNYLARNAVINGNAMAMAALGPVSPAGFDVDAVENGLRIEIADTEDYGLYRVGLRTFGSNDWDTLYTFTTVVDTIFGLSSGLYYLSACTVDSNGVESLFPVEIFQPLTVDVEEIPQPDRGITLLQNRPNPFDDATTIGVKVDRQVEYRQAQIVVRDMQGRELARYPISLKPGLNEVEYQYDRHNYQPGTYAYSLYVDGKLFDTKQMVYAY